MLGAGIRRRARLQAHCQPKQMDRHQTRPAPIPKGAHVMDQDKVIIVALHAFGVLMEMITLWYLCKIVLGKSTKSLKQTLIVFGLAGILLLGVSVFSTTVWQRMIGYLFGLLIPMMIFDGHILLKIFLAFLFFAIGSGSESLTKALFVAANGGLVTFTIKNSWGKFAQGLVISKFLAFAIIRI